MSVQDKPAYAAGVGHPSRARIPERTLRTDRWWLSPLLYVIGFSAWLIYGVVRAALQSDYWVRGLPLPDAVRLALPVQLVRAGLERVRHAVR